MSEAPFDGRRVFEARYYGHCGYDCGYLITPGDQVCFVDDEICHASCAEDAGEEVDRT